MAYASLDLCAVAYSRALPAMASVSLDLCAVDWPQASVSLDPCAVEGRR